VFGDYIVYFFLLFGLGNDVLKQLPLHTPLAYQRIAVVGFRNSVNFDLELIFHRI
jgi:hypothetical protein